MSQMSLWQARLADYLMKHDKRPPLEQVKSGFRIAGKMLAALAVALVFYGGCTMIKNSQHPSGWILGTIIIALSIITVAATVRFWMALDSLVSSHSALGALWVGSSSQKQITSPRSTWRSSRSLFSPWLSCVIGSRQRSFYCGRLTAPASLSHAICLLAFSLVGNRYKSLAVPRSQRFRAFDILAGRQMAEGPSQSA
jgi:hypothetical protein